MDNTNSNSFGIAANCKGLVVEYSNSGDLYARMIELTETVDSVTGESSFTVDSTEDLLISNNYNVQLYAEIASFDDNRMIATYHDNTLYQWSCYAQQLCADCNA